MGISYRIVLKYSAAHYTGRSKIELQAILASQIPFSYAATASGYAQLRLFPFHLLFFLFYAPCLLLLDH